LRGKNHSSPGGRKAYLSFELKDRRRPEAARLRRVLDFKIQIRSGLPCDEWDGVAGAANIVEMRTHKGFGRIDILKIRIEFDQKALSGSWR
jgi:hypothetical protein